MLLKHIIENEIQMANVKNDNKALGSVPNSLDISYNGITVKMKPSTFLQLAATNTELSNDNITNHIKSGGMIAPAFLNVQMNENEKPPTIVGHEGRHRMHAILQCFGDTPVETHLFFRTNRYSLRNRDITTEMVEMVNNGAYKENTNNFIKGPLFTNPSTVTGKAKIEPKPVVIEGRFELGEPTILKDEDYTSRYVSYILEPNGLKVKGFNA